MEMPEQPRDHPSLAKYPGNPTALYRDGDGVLWRVPLRRDRDDAVPVPIEDLVQARGAVHQLKLMLERGAGDDVELEMMGHVLTGTSAQPPPRTREDVIRYLDGLRDRLTGSLPDW
jgi:hypothetical protein